MRKHLPISNVIDPVVEKKSAKNKAAKKEWGFHFGPPAGFEYRGWILDPAGGLPANECSPNETGDQKAACVTHVLCLPSVVPALISLLVALAELLLVHSLVAIGRAISAITVVVDLAVGRTERLAYAAVMPVPKSTAPQIDSVA